MSQTGKPGPKVDSGGVDIDTLEETVVEVVETLDVTVQAAEFVQARSPDPSERERAAEIRQQAEAMLDAAEERGTGNQRSDRPGDQRTVH